MKEFVMLYPWSILLVVLTLSFVLLLYYFNRKKEASIVAFELIKIAEVLIMGKSKGEQRQNFVYKSLYPRLPKIIRLIYTQTQVYQFIDKIFSQNLKKLEKFINENDSYLK